MENKEYLRSLEEATGNKFIACESSNIAGYYYNNANHELWIAFIGKKVYQYFDVTPDEYKGLTLAESKGKWVNANLVKTSKKFQGYDLI